MGEAFKKRLYYNMIFLGNGEDSQKQVNLLHEKLEEAFSCLCGMQQWTDSPVPEQFQIDEENIKNTIKDIMAALGYNPSVPLVKLEYNPMRKNDEPL